jgi:DNA/RNA endonuclease YhcR with UshA esterase domain
MKTRHPRVAGLAVVSALLLLVAGLAACHDPANDQVPFTPPPEPEPTSTALDVIAWSEASSVIGQRMTVEGPVVSIQALPGGAAALNVGLDAPSEQRFVAIVPASVTRGLSAPAADTYGGALVRVTGVIRDVDGVASIRVARAKDIVARQ